MTVLTAAPSPADSIHGIPVERSTRPTNPPDASSSQMQGHASTWQQELAEIAGRSALVGMRHLVQELRVDMNPDSEDKKRPRASLTAVVALALSLVACFGVVGIALAHELGNSEYERKQAEFNAAQTQANAAQTEANRLFREALLEQRKAIYKLIDVLAESNPHVRSVERELQR